MIKLKKVDHKKCDGCIFYSMEICPAEYKDETGLDCGEDGIFVLIAKEDEE